MSTLAVDAITNATGTNAITIDSSGNLTTSGNVTVPTTKKIIAADAGSLVAPKIPIQINYIRNNAETSFSGGTSGVYIASSITQITALRASSDFIYHCAIPSEHDNTSATNGFAQLYRQINGGGFSYVDNCTTNLQAPGMNGTMLHSLTFMDYNYGTINAGDVIDYKVLATSHTSGASGLYHFNQPNLGSQPSNESTNFSHGWVMEIAQ